MRYAVIVIGDLGRSPRMQYHALSLAEAGGEVDLIGLDGAPVLSAVATHPRITCHRLPDRTLSGQPRGGVRRFVIGSAFRALGQGTRLLSRLMRLKKPDVLLVQNPPAIPTLSVGWLVSRLRGARFIIDWHNLSHTIAAVKVGDHHRVVNAVARSERRWARRADGHLAVSKALAAWLAREYRINATVVYDRPARAFARPSAAAAVLLRDKLAAQHHLGSQQPPLVVCPTSWTLDEDFDLLLEALERAERQLMKAAGATPALAVLLTGRGALRESFEHRAARRHFKAIAVKTAWLEPDEYPILIGMADLGLCLHQSSSGLDLPMKLADLRGANVPVATFDYAPVLTEVMTTGQEGVTFRDPGELAALLVSVATGTFAAASPLATSRTWLHGHPAERWDAQWETTAKPVLMG